jgi:hypothetical protein
MNIFDKIKSLFVKTEEPSVVQDDLWDTFNTKIRQGTHKPVEIDVDFDRITEEDLAQLISDGLIEFYSQMQADTDVQPPPILGYRIYATGEMLASWDTEALRQLEKNGTFVAPKFRSWIW